jgi:hypothetical protein
MSSISAMYSAVRELMAGKMGNTAQEWSTKTRQESERIFFFKKKKKKKKKSEGKKHQSSVAM